MAMDFTRLSEIVHGLGGEDADYGEFDAELGGLADVDAGADAKIDELTAQLADSERRYKETAAKNYELMMAATGTPDPEPSDDGDDSDADFDVDSLFGEE